MVAKDDNAYDASEPRSHAANRAPKVCDEERSSQDATLSIMRVDMNRAQFYAEPSRDIYARRPTEEKQAGEKYMSGKFNEAMSGTRRRPQSVEVLLRDRPGVGLRHRYGVALPLLPQGLGGLRLGAMATALYLGGSTSISRAADYMAKTSKVKVALTGPRVLGVKYPSTP